jgi:hypothetical protein
VYFEVEEGPGLFYVTTGFYCAQRFGGLAQAYIDGGWDDADFEFAVTFGIADGAITAEPGTSGCFYRARRFFPSVMCIPPRHEGLKPALSRDYGMWDYGMCVVPAISPQVFHDLENLMRTKLARMSDEGLRRTLKR